MTGVKQLPSGWWAAFIGGIWVDAASRTKEQAEEKLRKYQKGAKKNA